MSILNHVAIIMDGNQRWARSRGLPTKEGHKTGAENAFRIIESAKKEGVSHLSLYVFSSENLQRPKDEVDNFMIMINHYAKNELWRTQELGARVKFVGDLSRLDEYTQSNLRKVEEISSANDSIFLYIMISYGARSELVSACNKILSANYKAGEVSEEILGQNMYSDMPDVDLLIRTGDKMRISNFLLWQSAYAELYFSSKMWPDFSADDFEEAISEYNKRVRTFGRRISNG
ncbi:MAG: polyprenyl diphosphate synthase [Rickettsiaceae bacterium]|nr:polyprenyl diphosphate synthase [Rickettsiaceae bacterium]